MFWLSEVAWCLVEGPSIQLGGRWWKGVAHHLKVSLKEERLQWLQVAAAGLYCRLNAPIAGLYFRLKRSTIIFHVSWFRPWLLVWRLIYFTQRLWSNTSASYATCIPPLHLSQYWRLFFGVFSSGLGSRNSGSQYRPTLSFVREDLFPCSFSLFFLICLLSWFFQLAIFLKFLVVGTTGLGLAWVLHPVPGPSFYFVIRFIWSMLSYGSGLPGRNFPAHTSIRISL